VPERSCPSCHGPVADHQTLCPTCRTPVPSEAGPVASDTSAFTFGAPPPRQQRPAAPAPSPEPAIRSGGNPPDSIAGPPDQTAVAPQPQPQPAPQAPSVQQPVQPQGWGASAGVIGTPGAAVLDERGNVPGGVIGLVAAALVVVGVFLPWIGVEGRDVSGWSASGDAKILLGLAGVATVIAALLIGGARSLVLRLGLVGLGLVALGLGVFEITSASGIDEFDVSTGIGIPVVIGGGLALAVAGVLTRHRRFRPAA
jgi:hypothetical protein